MRSPNRSSSGDSRHELRLVTHAPLKNGVPPESLPLQQPRVVVPFIVIEHESEKRQPAPRVGILVFDPAAA